MRVKCLAQEHKTMSPARARTRTARSGDERTNHKATAPPLFSRVGCFKKSINFLLLHPYIGLRFKTLRGTHRCEIYGITAPPPPTGPWQDQTAQAIYLQDPTKRIENIQFDHGCTVWMGDWGGGGGMLWWQSPQVSQIVIRFSDKTLMTRETALCRKHSKRF